jgi:hypothetical protein
LIFRRKPADDIRYLWNGVNRRSHKDFRVVYRCHEKLAVHPLRGWESPDQLVNFTLYWVEQLFGKANSWLWSGWFIEGVGTRDLKETKASLEELAA